MKISFLLLLFFTVNGFCQQPLCEQTQFGSNPGNLKCFYYNKSTSQNKKPLVVVLHGCSQTAKQIDAITLWSNLALQNNFVAMYPQQKFLNNPNLCFNWFTESNQTVNEEIQSISTMVPPGIASFMLTSETSAEAIILHHQHFSRAVRIIN